MPPSYRRGVATPRRMASALQIHGAMLSLGWFVALFVVALVEVTPSLRPAARAAVAAAESVPLVVDLVPYGIWLLVMPQVWLALTVIGLAELALARFVRVGSVSEAVWAGAVWAGLATALLASAAMGLPAGELLVALAVLHVLGAGLALRSAGPSPAKDVLCHV